MSVLILNRQYTPFFTPPPGLTAPPPEEEDEPEVHGDGDEESDIRHRLCPTYASDINSPLRHVRTRIYFTSEVWGHTLASLLEPGP